MDGASESVGWPWAIVVDCPIRVFVRDWAPDCVGHRRLRFPRAREADLRAHDRQQWLRCSLSAAGTVVVFASPRSHRLARDDFGRPSGAAAADVFRATRYDLVGFPIS